MLDSKKVIEKIAPEQEARAAAILEIYLKLPEKEQDKIDYLMQCAELFSTKPVRTAAAL